MSLSAISCPPGALSLPVPETGLMPGTMPAAEKLVNRYREMGGSIRRTGARRIPGISGAACRPSEERRLPACRANRCRADRRQEQGGVPSVFLHAEFPVLGRGRRHVFPVCRRGFPQGKQQSPSGRNGIVPLIGDVPVEVEQPAHIGNIGVVSRINDDTRLILRQRVPYRPQHGLRLWRRQ